MISILIPIYNYEVIALARDLLVSCHKANVSFEIIFADDGSNVQYLRLNDALNRMEGIQYIVLPKNIGRSAIRNFLARTSKFDFLLF
ncbi:MAG: glycosyltransferase [Saprospiraceae bacterium]|uniref:Glycosyltransferase n=1 Tax=Candidatus Defluviibacterium haderslevense TaxID=2981993 RepID=A0A9D7XIX6_9BACT|nr:glycosyltransferase [Candidatus Defluviibacterium haderslevense]